MAADELRFRAACEPRKTRRTRCDGARDAAAGAGDRSLSARSRRTAARSASAVLAALETWRLRGAHSRSRALRDQAIAIPAGRRGSLARLPQPIARAFPRHAESPRRVPIACSQAATTSSAIAPSQLGAARLAHRRRARRQSPRWLLGRRSLTWIRRRRSQDHLGAESASALARPRPRLRPDRRSPLLRAFVAQLPSWLDANPPLARHQLGEHAGARLPLPLMALGAGLLRRRAASPTSAPWIVDLLSPRSAAHAHRAEPLALLQPEHASVRRGARALRRGSRAARTAIASARRRASAATSWSRKRPADPTPTAATRSCRRTITATPPTSTCSRLASPASAGDAAARPSKMRAAAGAIPAHHLRRRRTPAAPRRRRWRAAVSDLRPRADDCRDTLAAAAVAARRAGAGDRRRPPEETYWLCGDAAAGACRDRDATGRRLRSTASGYYVSRTPRGDHLVFDAGRTAFSTAATRTPTRLSVVLTASRHPLLVDPGTATYTMDRRASRPLPLERDAQHGRRSTARPQSSRGAVPLAHSTDARCASGAERRATARLRRGHARRLCTGRHTRGRAGGARHRLVIVDHILGPAGADVPRPSGTCTRAGRDVGRDPHVCA